MFEEIVGRTAGTPFKLIKRGKSLVMQNHEEPCSLAEPEFKHLRNFVAQHKLQRGFEVATAFGVSTLAIALGMKETGGVVVSMDAYIEEQFNSCVGYLTVNKTYHDADGFKTASFLLKEFGAENHGKLAVGISPRDTGNTIKAQFGDNKIDFVFIDAQHTDSAAIKDFDGVLPYIDRKRFAIFFHDVHCFQGALQRHISDKLNMTWSIVPGCTHPGDGYNLACITNII